MVLISDSVFAQLKIYPDNSMITKAATGGGYVIGNILVSGVAYGSEAGCDLGRG